MDDRLLMWLEWIFRHKGKVIGAVLGLLFGWMAIRIGVFRTVFVAVCLGIGIGIGNSMDSGESLTGSVSKILDWLGRLASSRSSRWR